MTHSLSHRSLVLVPAPARARAGFTLIEVLIGVIVLGLGLLGLASVFPAVVVQQKQAADAVQGDSTARSVESFMRASPRLSEPYVGVFDRMRIDARFSDPAQRSRWELGDGAGESGLLDFADGDLFVAPVERNNTVPEIDAIFPAIARSMDAAGELRINQFMRLYPAPKFRGLGTQNPPPTPADLTLREKGDAPQFIWDVAFRRDRVVIPRNPADPEHVGRAGDTLQVAMFIRRIDLGIRGDLDTVFNPNSNARVFAVAENNQGVPSLDGRGRYSPIRRATLVVAAAAGNTAAPRNRVYISPASVEGVNSDDTANDWLARTGQKFVGPQGQIWTVLAVGDETIEATDRIVMTLDANIEDLAQAGLVQQVDVLCTLQTPAAVRVFTLEPPQRQVFAQRP